MRDELASHSRRTLAEIKFCNGPEEESDTVFDWCSQAIQTVITQMPLNYAKVLLKESLAQLDEDESRLLQQSYGRELFDLNQKTNKHRNKLDEQLNKIRKLLIYWKKKAISKVNALQSEIELSQQSFCKLERQVRDLDTDRVLLSGKQKPDFVKSLHNGFAKKKNDLKLKMTICN